MYDSGLCIVVTGRMNSYFTLTAARPQLHFGIPSHSGRSLSLLCSLSPSSTIYLSRSCAGSYVSSLLIVLLGSCRSRAQQIMNGNKGILCIFLQSSRRFSFLSHLRSCLDQRTQLRCEVELRPLLALLPSPLLLVVSSCLCSCFRSQACAIECIT